MAEWIAELVEEELKSIELADIEHGIEDVRQLTVYLTSLAHRVAQRQRDLDAPTPKRSFRLLAQVVRQLTAERDKAVELNEWYRKRCVWYQQELDAQSRAETAGSLRDMRRAEIAERERDDALKQVSFLK